MSINKFITDILNVNPDKIEPITTIDNLDGSITITIKLKHDKSITCPFCKGKVKIHGYYSRKLTHSTLVNRKCILIYQQRRYHCASCDFTFHERNPFINTKENVTYETKINVLKDLKYPNITYSFCARKYNLSITKVQQIFDKHVNIPRKLLPEVLSIDEHYFPQSNYDSLYCCLLMDFVDGTLIDVLPDRRKKYLISYFSNIKNKTLDVKTNTSELNNVKYISIDLYENYKDIAKTYFPKAIICGDSFHVLKNLTECFKRVRLNCRRRTEDENLAYLLVKFKFIFHHGINLDNTAKFNKRFNRYMNYRDMMNLLFQNFPELEKAYDLKEKYIIFNSTCEHKDATVKLTEMIELFGNSGIPEYNDFYNLLINWFDEIVNSFIIIKGRRINNSYIESRNNIVERLFYNANGFTNFKRTRNRILYCINKLDSYKI